jgi:LacI family transcriptional regulator
VIFIVCPLSVWLPRLAELDIRSWPYYSWYNVCAASGDLPGGRAVVKVTLRDVARAAGVSMSTVSRVVCGQADGSRIPPSTVRRIQDAVAQLGYVPNQTARSLRNQRAGQVGVVMGAQSYSELPVALWLDGTFLTGLNAAARAHHLPAVVLYPLDGEEAARPAHYLDGRVDGLLVRCVLRSEGRLLQLADPARLPVVAVWRQCVPDHVGYADVDHTGGAVLAVRHLLELGHRRIAYMGPDLDDDNLHFALRYQGYCAALREAGLSPRPDWHARDIPGVLALLRADDPITAVFAAHDQRAAELAAALAAAGVRIPADVSLVGFDDFPNATLSAGGLTTVRQPLAEMAIAGLHNLLALIEGAPAAACRTLIPAPLIVRNSTGPPPPR